ncbi:MAG: radical SAM protein [Elusimicrobia bacterium]|nr:radical SAM protein [Elusimicrobiota bacterium]
MTLFYRDMLGENLTPEQLSRGMLIPETRPRLFLEQFLRLVAPANHSSLLFSLTNDSSPLYQKITHRFDAAIKQDFASIRWAPGAVDLLQSLRRKYRLVAVSNLWAYQKRHLLRELGLGEHFDQMFFSCDTGIPRAQMLGQLVQRLGTDARDIVCVGRSYEYDILPAVNAGLSALRLECPDNVIHPDPAQRLIDEEFTQEPAPTTARPPEPEALVVIPPFYKLLGSHNNRINLGAAELAAYLGGRGCPTRVYHCDSEPHESYATRYQMVFNSIEFYEALKNDRSFKDFERYYRQQTADLVFVTCGDILNPSVDSGNWDASQKIAAIARRINPKAFIVAVGPEIGRESADFDLIVHGEIEPLLDAIRRRAPRGRVKGELLSQEELHRFPVFDPACMATPVSPVSWDTVIWRRGCLGTCDFCRVAQINQGRIRAKAVETVFREINWRYRDLGVRNFYIVDANFTANRDMVLDFCRRLKSRFPDIHWRTESRFDTLDEELLRAMSASGCSHLKLGLENTLHERHQVKTKRVSLSNAEAWIKKIQASGIKCVVYLLLGGKWFTPAQYRQMYANAKALDADGYTVSLFNPYPDTPSGIPYEEWRRRGFIGSHLDIRLIDFWKIPLDVVEDFFRLELGKGREDRTVRSFTGRGAAARIGTTQK